MSNNTSTRTDEMAMLLDQSNAHGIPDDTTINIENDIGPSTSHHQQLHLNRRESNTTRLSIDANVSSGGVNGGIGDSANPNVDDRQHIRNFISILREARHQLHRPSSRDHQLAGTGTTPAGGAADILASATHPRTWRENLYDVLASPVTPRTDVLRAIFTSSSSGNFRYNSLPTNDNPTHEDNLHFMLNSPDQDIQVQHHRNHPADIGVETQSTSTSGLRLSRQNSRLDERSMGDNTSSTSPTTPVVGDLLVDSGSRRQSNGAASSAVSTGRLPQRQTSVAGSTAPTIEMDDPDSNAMGEMIVKLVSHFVRYLPFICILLVKFIHDHLLGLLDLIVLHAVMFHINKSLKEQIAKLNQKSYTILARDTILVISIVTYRFILATSTPDPFGLLINPPGEKLTLDLSFNAHAHEKTEGMTATLDPVHNYFNHVISIDSLNHNAGEVPLDPTSNLSNSGTISLTKTISLGVLLYYVACNDLILKLLTQLVKISVTMLPTKAIRHKSRARLYALIEYASQFYRALAPMRQWLTFLFESYTGLEIISGILFSSFYLGAKGFEFVERGKSLKKAIVNFISNMDYDRKPTKDELDAAGTVCPICHDAYTTPVLLECGHIFCDECVNTWFKREQTCPMCRAKVSEDPAWQDGSTTYFYQLF